MNADSGNERRDDFVRLANQRMTKLLKQIELIGNLSNKYRYDFTDKDVKVMFGELDAAVRKAKNRFELSSGSSGSFRIKK